MSTAEEIAIENRTLTKTVVQDSPTDALDTADAFDAAARTAGDIALTRRTTVRRDTEGMLQELLTGAPLLAADAISMLTAASVALLLWPAAATPTLIPLTLFLSGAFVMFCMLVGLYPGAGLHPVVELRQISIATVLLFTASFAATFMATTSQSYTGFLLLTGLLTLLLAPLLRSLVRKLLAPTRWWGHPVLIFGGGDVGERTYRYLNDRRSLGFRPIGIVDDLYRHWDRQTRAASAYLGPLEEAPAIARRHRVHWAVIAMSDRPAGEAHEVVQAHAWSIPHVLVISDVAGFPSLLSRPCDCAGLLGIEIKASLLLPVPRLIKRTLDLLSVLVGGAIMLPLLLMIAAVIKLTSPGPVLYCQQRIGRNGCRFYAWKFRTMVTDSDRALQRYLAEHPQARDEWRRTHKLRDDPRITSVGRWLRKTSLDELPQIWNVLLGEMSLVGPRPIVDDEIPKYDETFESYLRVRPGITGLWQVSGRNNTTYAERVAFDSYYVSNWSPWLDVYILARTVRVVLRQDGAY